MPKARGQPNSSSPDGPRAELDLVFGHAWQPAALAGLPLVTTDSPQAARARRTAAGYWVLTCRTDPAAESSNRAEAATRSNAGLAATDTDAVALYCAIVAGSW